MNDPWQGGEEVLEVVEDVAGALDLPGKGVHVRLPELKLAPVVPATPADKMSLEGGHAKMTSADGGGIPNF